MGTSPDIALVARNQAEQLGAFLHDAGRKAPEKIRVWDETLRDGEQSPGVCFTAEDKLDIAKLLDGMGVAVIDAGFPMVSEEERRAITAIAREGLSAAVGATVRAVPADIDAALRCEVREVHMFLPTSGLHLRHKLGISAEDAISRAVAAVEHAKRHGLVVDFIAEDATRTPMEYLLRFYRAVIDAGADRVMLTDTVGVMSPEAMFRFSRMVMDALGKKAEFAVHCHNDFGLAVANTLAAVLAGATYPTVTVNGIGERAGNAAFEETVIGLEHLYGIRTGIATERLAELSLLVERRSGMFNQPHKPVVGFNAFRHESGIHVDGVLQHTGTYEPIQPEEVGCCRSFVLGKHSGRSLVTALLASRALTASEEQVRAIAEDVKLTKERSPRERIHRTAHERDAYHREVLGFPEEQFWQLVQRHLGDAA